MQSASDRFTHKGGIVFQQQQELLFGFPHASARAELFFSHILSQQCAASALLYGRSGATSPLLPPLCTLTSLLTFLDGIARVPHSRILPDWDHVYKKIGLMQRFPLFKIYSRPPADQKRGHSLHLGSQSGQYAWKNASSRRTNAFLDAKKLACAPRMGHPSRMERSGSRAVSRVSVLGTTSTKYELNFFNFFAVLTLGYHSRSTLLADSFLFCLHGSTARAFQNIMFLFAAFALRLLSQLRLLKATIATFSHCSPLMGRLKLRKKNAALKKTSAFKLTNHLSTHASTGLKRFYTGQKKAHQKIILKIKGF